jgi:hypothetical protein
MVFHPAILANLVGSILVSLMILYSASYAFQILRKWDLPSGSELQLTLERKTYLVSTLLAYVFAFELFSLFLFIFTTDELHPFFIGAMCAAGSLYANPYGYLTLILKLFNFLLIGVWLVLNRVDNEAPDYPLIRRKYLYFLLLVPLILLETVLEANYFLRLRPNVITSCCGTLFGSGIRTLPSQIGGLPRVPAMAAFYGIMILTLGAGVYYIFSGKGGRLFSGFITVAFLVSTVSIFSFISVFIYELPTHHCPFCMLQGEYGYIGYPIYLTLLGGTISGLGVGALMPFRKIASLTESLPSVQRKLALTSGILFLLFVAIVTVRILLSNLSLAGY